MTYFLDFDRTLFDYEAFFLYLIELPELALLRPRMLIERDRPISGTPVPERIALWSEIDALYVAGRFSFEPGSLSQFVFADAAEFLRSHGDSSVIVTSGGVDLSFQKGKVAGSGLTDLVSLAEFVPRGVPKGPLVAKLLPEYSEPYYFIDDLPEQIDSVVEHSPSVLGYEMRRDDKAGSGKYPMIKNLLELPQ